MFFKENFIQFLTYLNSYKYFQETDKIYKFSKGSVQKDLLNYLGKNNFFLILKFLPFRDIVNARYISNKWKNIISEFFGFQIDNLQKKLDHFKAIRKENSKE